MSTACSISLVEPKTGKLSHEDKTDNWGYNYNGFTSSV